MKITFNEQEDNLWICTDFKIAQGRPPVRLILTSDNEPSNMYVSEAIEQLKQLDELVLSASGLILENYSYEHYKDLGVPEDRLEREETPEAISKRAVLRSIWFMSDECDEFELSFELPWDNYHSYDVEFQNGEPANCAVNG
ncbi:hypothetical protein FJD32_023345 (plasmid) [Shewanella sp. LC6]|uniref:hypothetical protein n=1 Tax=unclassified Shewanella TaxID=196818 RepID=UPI0011288AB1|nr:MULTISPECIES: hypothetical protein [unclassified Shewanella]QQK62345.1 hypothetical protein FJD32_023345 [Shewanella sp. LC6]TPE64703.1 hypothetical protein FJD33_02330 [Shewanella sp. LC2]